MGDSIASTPIVIASVLNSPVEVSENEYSKQQLAATWKTFSLLPSRGFFDTITLPNIASNSFMIGLREIVDDFSNASNSSWKTDSLASHTYQWTGSALKSVSNVLSSYGKIDSATGWGQNKEIDFTVRFSPPSNATSGAAFTMFCLRQNCLGDERGYLVTAKKVTSSTTGLSTIFFEMRKGAGIRNVTGTTYTSDFGSPLLATQTVTFSDYTPVRIKLFTNSSGLPEVKIWVTNILDTDIPLTWGSGGTASLSYIDVANTYRYAGNVTIVTGTGIGGTFEFRYANLVTDDVEGKIYIRDVVGEGAENEVIYSSAMEISYEPV
jgi:hypothetical protein